MPVTVVGKVISYFCITIAARQGCCRQNAAVPYPALFADNVLIEGSLTVNLNIQIIKTSPQSGVDKRFKYIILFVFELEMQPRFTLGTYPAPSLPAFVPLHLTPAGTLDVIRQIVAA